MGANYEDVLKRLYNEGMICRFTLMFLNDDSYPKLEQALKEGNVKEAFRAAHTLKGVCQNLGFTNLYQPTYDLTEVLRTGTLEGTKELFDSVTCQYKITINAIRALLCTSHWSFCSGKEMTGGDLSVRKPACCWYGGANPRSRGIGCTKKP